MHLLEGEEQKLVLETHQTLDTCQEVCSFCSATLALHTGENHSVLKIDRRHQDRVHLRHVSFILFFFSSADLISEIL